MGETITKIGIAHREMYSLIYKRRGGQVWETFDHFSQLESHQQQQQLERNRWRCNSANITE